MKALNNHVKAFEANHSMVRGMAAPITKQAQLNLVLWVPDAFIFSSNEGIVRRDERLWKIFGRRTAWEPQFRRVS